PISLTHSEELAKLVAGGNRYPSPFSSATLCRKPKFMNSSTLRCFRVFNSPAIIEARCLSSTAAAINTQNSFRHATHLFDELPQGSISSLNSQLALLARRGNFLALWDQFRTMHRASLRLDAYTFTPVLSACSALPAHQRGTQVHALMIKTGVGLGTISKTALMDMYSKYGYLGDSVAVFGEMESPDVVSWNALISSYLREDLAEEALGAFVAMRDRRVEFSEFTLCSVVKACDLLKASLLGKQVHSLVIVMGRDMVVLGTALIDFYSAVGEIRQALRIFTGLSWKKDNVMWNCLVSGCVKNRRYKEAFGVVSMMRPNSIGLTSILTACSEISDLQTGMQVHCVATRYGFVSQTQLCNALLDMYAKCGRISKCMSVFDKINSRDVVSWTTMIDAYGRHGYGVEALELFNKMEEEANMVSPNAVTFLAILSACGHAGLVNEGLQIFKVMKEKYGLQPAVEHYSCFIDVLGRARLIEDAWSLYEDMISHGMRPTSAIWASLLNVCNLNQDASRDGMMLTA
ncbi:Pentatricopeptide repeat-containing protein At5g66500, mitochondrial, partial [Linum grandiflorum]